MKACFKLAAAAVLMTITSVAYAADSLSAHQHGAGSLDVAVEGNSVLMELRVPGQDLLGFEQLKTELQKSKAQQAVALLKQQWFSFNAQANCQLVEAEAEIETEGEEDHHADHDQHQNHTADKNHADHDEKHGDDHDKDHADHQEHAADNDHDEDHEGHDEKHSDDHDKDHADHQEHAADKDQSGHIEFHASWLYQCQQTEQINSLTSNLFERFPGSQQLKLRILLPTGQKLGQLTAKNNQFNF